MANTNQHSTPSGMVRVWDITRKEWRDTYAVDARELLRVGAASLSAPDVPMTGPAGNVVVCEAEVQSYVDRGYKLADAPTGITNAAVVADESDDKEDRKNDGGGEHYKFDAHTIVELRQFAQRAGVEGATSMNKAALVSALEASNWQP